MRRATALWDRFAKVLKITHKLEPNSHFHQVMTTCSTAPLVHVSVALTDLLLRFSIAAATRDHTFSEEATRQRASLACHYVFTQLLED